MAQNLKSAFFAAFFEHFNGLLISQEKTINRVRNCLTVLKTANIMPHGGRDFYLATVYAGRARRPTVDARRRFFETLGRTRGAGRTEYEKTVNGIPALAF